MDNPGVYSLTQHNGAGDVTVTAAGTVETDWVTGLDGMLAATISAPLAYGSGGTTIRCFIQTSLDGGVTPIDIACILFGTAGEAELVNLSGLTPKTTPAAPGDGTLADDTCLDGVLGDRLRCKIVSTGTYAGSTVLSVRAAVR
jgi:hypothetical protein